MKNWNEFLEKESKKEYYIQLIEKIHQERKYSEVYPEEEDLFSCFALCPYDKVKVVILGQDPYHGAGQAHGLSFSVKPGVKIPPSLRNIYKELKTDLGIDAPENGCLIPWAKQGVLLLNTSMTVSAGKAGSHKKFGWSTFTNNVLEELNNYPEPLVFILWGNHAINAAKNISNPLHLRLTGVHPSPLAGGGFFGCKHFSKANEFLEKSGRGAVNWSLD